MPTVPPLNFPAAQSRQAASPLVEVFPAPQTLHALLLAGEYVPSLHDAQAEDLGEEEYLPEPHSLQAGAAEALYFPEGQVLQEGRPGVDILPLSQSVQTEAAAGENSPAKQFSHLS